MIANWIAGALLRGQDHLRLNKKELVDWQLQGCRVSKGSPHNLWGQYARMHVGKIRLSIQQRLLETPTDLWPTEPLSGWKNGGPTVVLPPLEARPETDGTWLMPLLPTAEGHALDAWNPTLKLDTEEWEALRPLARVLAGRCLLTSYTSTTAQITCEGVPWDPCRLELAELAGIRPSELRAFFKARDATSPFREDQAPVTLQMMHGLVQLRSRTPPNFSRA